MTYLLIIIHLGTASNLPEQTTYPTMEACVEAAKEVRGAFDWGCVRVEK